MLQMLKQLDARVKVGIAAGAAVMLVAMMVLLGLLLTRNASLQAPEETDFSVYSEASTGPTLPPNPYLPEDFVLQDGYMTCLSGHYIPGVDVSFWQGQIDWPAVYKSGMRFAMIRLGWRGSEQGLMFPDDYVEDNYTGARSAGLMVGGYFFSQAISVEEAVEEADYVLEILDGRALDLPIVYDWEYISKESRTGNMEARLLTDCALAFCKTIEEAGYEAMVYFNLRQGKDLYHLLELTDYPFWLALYNETMECPYKVDMWQYTNAGKVPGINTDVDLNLLFVYDE